MGTEDGVCVVCGKKRRGKTWESRGRPHGIVVIVPIEYKFHQPTHSAT